MFVLCTRSEMFMRQIDAALLAEGLTSRWIHDPPAHAHLLDVPVSEIERVSHAVSMQFEDNLAAALAPPQSANKRHLFLQPSFALGASMAMSLCAFYMLVGGKHSKSVWYHQGLWTRTHASQWWRYITAATLHSDGAHVASNAMFILVLGWAAADFFGAGLTALCWLLSAVAGFVVSEVFGDALVTVGASGGVFGLLGMAAAGAWLLPTEPSGVLHPRARALGAALMLLAFTAFAKGSNIEAHLGGFVAGFAFGAASRTLRRLPYIQALALVLMLFCVIYAWGTAMSWTAPTFRFTLST